MLDIHSFEPIWPEWKIDHLIGRGSFGTVYQAHREDLYVQMVQHSAVKHILIFNEAEESEMLPRSY